MQDSNNSSIYCGAFLEIGSVRLQKIDLIIGLGMLRLSIFFGIQLEDFCLKDSNSRIFRETPSVDFKHVFYSFFLHNTWKNYPTFLVCFIRIYTNELCHLSFVCRFQLCAKLILKKSRRTLVVTIVYVIVSGPI